MRKKGLQVAGCKGWNEAGGLCAARGNVPGGAGGGVFVRVPAFFLFLAVLFLLMPALAVSPRPARAANAARLFHLAEICEKNLMANPESQKFRDRWLACIEKFESVYRVEPEGTYAAAGLYRAGALYRELGRRSGKPSDTEESLDCFRRILKRFPKSSYAPKARAMLGETPRAPEAASAAAPAQAKPPVKTGKKGATKTSGKEPPGKPPGKPQENGHLPGTEEAAYCPAPPPRGPAAGGQEEAPAAKDARLTGKHVVTQLRFWSNPTYTRVVIDADSVAPFQYELLRPDTATGKPPRLFVDFKSSRVGKGMKSQIPIQDNLLIQARAAQYDLDTVRVVVDIKSFKSYSVFPLNNPYRVVIDVRGTPGPGRAPQTAPPPLTASRTPPPEPGPLPPPRRGEAADPGSLVESLGLGVRRIVVDPGHGGHDCGAPGFEKGVFEKHVVLEISKRLARRLRKETGCEVILTRETDKYLTLEERTAIANTQNADLFISVHTNAHRSATARGIETYFLNLATDKESVLVAARENATSEKNISDLQAILNDLMQNMKIAESQRLARNVQTETVRGTRRKFSKVNDKGVKQAPFYVLLGAEMPAVLVETGFISNKEECKRLRNAEYQEYLVSGIVGGVKKYMESIHAAKRP